MRAGFQEAGNRPGSVWHAGPFVGGAAVGYACLPSTYAWLVATKPSANVASTKYVDQPASGWLTGTRMMPPAGTSMGVEVYRTPQA